jgi:hypothetical protein
MVSFRQRENENIDCHFDQNCTDQGKNFGRLKISYMECGLIKWNFTRCRIIGFFWLQQGQKKYLPNVRTLYFIKVYFCVLVIISDVLILTVDQKFL